VSDTAALVRDFKAAMRSLASTVTVITTRDNDEHHGMAATAVTSLSTQPPSLLVCVNQSASLHGPIQTAARFCVNLLTVQHAPLVEAFGGTLTGAARFGVGDWRSDGEGVRYLSDAAANIFCTLDHKVDYGTHTIFIGRVEQVRVLPNAEPLLYYSGGVGTFTALK
jgi:flavin reductase (DIM6/NTAB) family NADH-FMN oxidoreductase RutF